MVPQRGLRWYLAVQNLDRMHQDGENQTQACCIMLLFLRTADVTSIVLLTGSVSMSSARCATSSQRQPENVDMLTFMLLTDGIYFGTKSGAIGLD